MCNLNPVWNEELMLSVLQNYKPDKVVKSVRVAPVRLGWEARFYRLFHCLAFGRVEVGFPRIWGEPWGWRRSSSRPWPHRPVSRWLVRHYLPLKKQIQ
ncbi:hypothetical protein Hanom_Chr05g00415001 [Helianthus anomalus]